MIKIKREGDPPCCFLKHQSDIVRLSVRYDSRRDREWSVPMWKSAHRYEKGEQKMRITVLVRKVSAKYCAPLSEISLSPR